MTAIKVIVHNEQESRTVEALINLLNGGKSNNICKEYSNEHTYEAYPRFVFGNSSYINTCLLNDKISLTNFELLTIDELRRLWIQDERSAFSKDSDLKKYRIVWNEYRQFTNKHLQPIMERSATIEAYDVFHATQVWHAKYVNENTGNVISCKQLS